MEVETTRCMDLRFDVVVEWLRLAVWKEWNNYCMSGFAR